MQYLLQIYSQEDGWATMSPELQEHWMGAYMAYRNALIEAGAFVGSSRLEPSTTATTVRVTPDGKTAVLDGPYADTKEQLGGYFLIEAPDLDAAIAWAARCPGASHGTVEVRPLAPVPAPV